VAGARRGGKDADPTISANGERPRLAGPRSFIAKSASNRYRGAMPVALELAVKQKRPPGQPCCVAPVRPDVSSGRARRLASLAKALGDPTRVQLVDVLRKAPGEVCVCELQPLFDISQPTLSRHLKVLREAGLVGVERRGLWAYYYVRPEATEELTAWLS
jgi:ArsR family transcriptional regulator, arsenate/arsenite/antimonite-responsive transcriptional repressor